MADKKRRAPMPPLYKVHGNQPGVNTDPVREITNPAYTEADEPQQGRKVMSVPLPDYETLFPQKRHGVQGHTRWDHIIAEVNQKHRDSQEMSVDGPLEHEPSLRLSPPQESPAIKHYQTQPQETKPVSSKKVAAPTPPKSVSPPQPRSDSSRRQSQNTAQQSLMRSNLPAVPEPVNASRESLSGTSRDGARKALRPPPAATRAPRPTSQVDLDTPDDDKKVQVNVKKDEPTAKPRQKANGKEPEQQDDSALTPVVSDKYINSNIQTLSSSRISSTDRNDRQERENFEFDPFPSTDLLSKDPWAQLTRNQDVDDPFASSVQKEQKVEDRGMSQDDLDNIFSQEKHTDPFDFNGSDSKEPSEYRTKDEDSKHVSLAFQRRNSSRQKLIIPSIIRSDNNTSKSREEPTYEAETTVTTAYQGLSARGVRNASIAPKLPADAKTQSKFNGGEDPFGAEPFTPTLTSPEPLQVVVEEPASQAGSKFPPDKPLRVWVSPSDVQPVSAQNSNGGGLAFTPRRPHPVKPMSLESQAPISSPAVKEIKVRESPPGKIQVAHSVQSGPYTQLTQEELITLVVRQQADLSRKDSQIVELEEYIDRLLVRVIEEQPGILQSLNAAKPV